VEIKRIKRDVSYVGKGGIVKWAGEELIEQSAWV
jgi:hypothetical protein